MNVQIAVASKHGSTQEIGEAIADGLRRRGATATVIDLDDLGSIVDVDGIVIGSAVYAGRWMREARRAIDTLGPALHSRPVWLFSSGPIGDEPKPAGDPADAAELVERLEARGHRTFAGKLDPAELGRLERTVARAVHAEAGDFRDWDAIDAYAAEIYAALEAERVRLEGEPAASGAAAAQA